MSKYNFTCIICPRGCSIDVDEQLNVTGNFCPRGKEYVLNEIKCPLRTLTSTIRISNRDNIFVSVKTSKPIPKDKVMELNNYIRTLKIKAPIKIGAIIDHNPLGLDADIVATKNIS